MSARPPSRIVLATVATPEAPPAGAAASGPPAAGPSAVAEAASGALPGPGSATPLAPAPLWPEADEPSPAAALASPQRTAGPMDSAEPAPPQPLAVTLEAAALDRLMPMCLVLDRRGVIAHVGPTLAKLLPAGCPGQPLAGMASFRRPYAATTPEEILRSGGRVTLAFGAELPPLRGQAVPLGGGGVLLNLTLGLSVVEEIERRDLAPGDFAHTDLTVELLYMVEAKSAILREGQRLNARLAEAKKAAEVQALTDTLTGLANRRAMEQTLDELLKLGAGFGLLQLDLDFFKQVNDTLGHAAGDHVLQTVGALLRGFTRPGDTVARTGGDEFLLILPGTTDPAQLRAVGERLVEGISHPIDYDGQFCRVAASVGATATAFYDRPDADRMLSDADEALYASKRSGRSQVSLWHPDL